MKFNIKKGIELIIFSSKWILIPFYLVLMGGLVIYTFFDVKEFFHFIGIIGVTNKDGAMLTFVELIDMTMIAALGKQLITGGYHSFVSKKHGQEENASSGMLKVKMGSSLVGITSISLLKLSIEFTTDAHVKATWDDLFKVSFVHGVFLLSVLILAKVDFWHEKSETFHKEEPPVTSTNEVATNHIPISTSADHKHH